MHVLKMLYGFSEVRYLPLSQLCLQLSALLLQRCDLFVFTQLRVCVLRQVSGSLTGKRTLVLLHSARFHQHRSIYLETAGVYIQIIYNNHNQCYELLQRSITAFHQSERTRLQINQPIACYSWICIYNTCKNEDQSQFTNDVIPD